jgi:hypothetical protein
MHPATEAILAYFEHGHLPPRQSQMNLEGPELTAGLRKLLEAKDCCVRASL